MWTRLRTAISLALAISLSCPAAHAQDASQRAIAERLFVEGKTFMQEKEYERACPKFEESFRLDPTAMGTLLNLALCHEAMGRPASAWSEFRAAAAGSRGKRDDRVKLAEEHAAALAGQLSFLTVKVPDEARVPGLAVQLDGHAILPAAWGTELPVDPGARVVEASAPGKVSWREEITISKSGDKRTVTVARLRDQPKELARPAPTVDVSASLAAADAIATVRARRIVGFSLAGLGVVGVGAGAIFGVLAIRKNQDATGLCPGDHCKTSADAESARGSITAAKTDAAVSNIATGLGIAALAGGVLLVLLSPTPAEGRVRPAAGPAPLGLGAEATF